MPKNTSLVSFPKHARNKQINYPLIKAKQTFNSEKKMKLVYIC